MKLSVIARAVALMGLCVGAVPIMGAGTDCPKKCTVEGVKCAQICGGPETFECIYDGSVLKCLPP